MKVCASAVFISGHFQIHRVSTGVVNIVLLWELGSSSAQTVLRTQAHALVADCRVKGVRMDRSTCVRLTTLGHPIVTVLPRIRQVTVCEDTASSTEPTNKLL